MRFEVPRDFPPLTDDDKRSIRESVEVHDGFVYFHRVPNPTKASVIYSTGYIIELLIDSGYTALILDFTGRDLVNHQLRRLMLSRASDMIKQITDVVIVLDGNSFRRVVIDFFVRAYIRRHDCTVEFFSTKEEAISHMRESVQSDAQTGKTDS